MTYAFAGTTRSIAQPMPVYFNNPYLQLFHFNVSGATLNEQPIDRYVDEALRSGSARGNLGAMLQPLGVKYVLLVLNRASSQFRYVLDQQDLEVMARWPDLVLLRNKAPVSRAYLTGSRGEFRSWSAAAPQARGADLTGSHIVRGTGTSIPPRASTPVARSPGWEGAVQVRLPDALTGDDTVLLSEPYNQGWRLGKQAPTTQFGIICAYPVRGAAQQDDITYHNPYLLAGYIIGSAGFALCVILIVATQLATRRKRSDE
jgi:hypothetical protein